jgi:hypothetical protein
MRLLLTVRIRGDTPAAYDRTVQEVRWGPPARPFFGPQEGEGLAVLARPAGLEPTTFRSAT